MFLDNITLYRITNSEVIENFRLGTGGFILLWEYALALTKNMKIVKKIIMYHIAYIFGH